MVEAKQLPVGAVGWLWGQSEGGGRLTQTRIHRHFPCLYKVPSNENYKVQFGLLCILSNRKCALYSRRIQTNGIPTFFVRVCDFDLFRHFFRFDADTRREMGF